MATFNSRPNKQLQGDLCNAGKPPIGAHPSGANDARILKIQASGYSPPALYLLFLFLSVLAVMLILHVPYLRLPYFWDEMGQFVPASLDLYQYGAWVPYSVPPNVHPPGVMALLAAVWRVFGYSILSTRLTMLIFASLGLLFTFMLTARLSHGKGYVPAFVTVLFLTATPIFYTQSMMVTLDVPVMTFTVLALLMFLQEKYSACAVVCVLLVLIKETSVTTPAVFAAWLWFRRKERRTSLYFVSPAIALGLWLLLLHHETGHWLGNSQFARENVNEALSLHHLLVAIVVRIWFIFVADGHFLGTTALFIGWRQIRGCEWTLAALVAAGQIAMVTVLGGAELDRYLIPALPIFYAAIASAAYEYPLKWRWRSHIAMILLLLLGWRWNPPYPYPFENNLTMVDFIRLQQEAAEYLEKHAPDKRIASVWPFTFAIQHPELGYVKRSFKALDAPGLRISDLASLDRTKVDLLVVYKRFSPIRGTWIDIAPLRPLLHRLHHYYDVQVEATDEEISAELGFTPLQRYSRGDQWIVIYQPQRAR